MVGRCTTIRRRLPVFLRHNDPVPLPILRLNETLCLSFRRDTYPACKRLLRDTTQIRDPLKSTIKLPVLLLYFIRGNDVLSVFEYIFSFLIRSINQVRIVFENITIRLRNVSSTVTYTWRRKILNRSTIFLLFPSK